MIAAHLYDCDPEADRGTPVPDRDRRPLALIAAAAMDYLCEICWSGPGEPCDAPGMHLARLARARRRRSVSAADMAVVLAAAPDVFEPSTVIPVPVPAGAAS
jgi:hypothetical protein